MYPVFPASPILFGKSKPQTGYHNFLNFKSKVIVSQSPSHEKDPPSPYPQPRKFWLQQSTTKAEQLSIR